MTIDEAIKELETALADKWCPWSKELKASIQLGIEALKGIKLLREDRSLARIVLLAGETEE